MLEKITLPAIPATRQTATDYFTVCDMAGFIQAAESIPANLRESGSRSWVGFKGFAESLDCVRNGDLTAVPESDEFLEQMEEHTFVSRKFRRVKGYTGSSVNVAAFLSGVPAHMRRRKRMVADTAPLSIFVDLTSSGGIEASDLRKRGCAILALVRLMANLRPVELFTVVASEASGHKDCFVTIVRLDTTPLDLARAAHMLSHPSVPRAICYSLVYQHAGSKLPSLTWPYGVGPDTFRRNGEAILRRAVTPGSDVLFVPAIHISDKAIQDPVAWIKDMLHQYGGDVVQENGD